MVKESQTKIYKVGHRHSLYLKADLVTDSNFPFQPGEDLTVRIDGSKLVVEKKA